jgi:putative endopeptidase
MSIVSIKNMTKTFQIGEEKLDALKNLNLTIKKGEYIAIMGPSGSGKSTMLNLLGCLDTPTKGQYFLDGLDIATLEDDVLSKIRGKKIGFIFQSYNLISQLNIIENIEVPMYYQGISEAQSKEKFAFYQAYNKFSQVVGLYYGKNYFGPVAKQDVKKMVHEIIGVYNERITNNTWLNEKTKENAIKKLSTLSVHVGYPDELPPYYDQFEVISYEQGSDLLKEKLKMTRIINELNYEKYNKAPNRNIWGMPASMVNAYYSPTNNQIVFPAAILQKPYYSLEQNPSENYGGIGAVMAHEISHAFDNNGAKFDENGSLSNWWTDEDLEAFKKKSKDMIDLFEGVETGNGSCNGELTVSENIADSAGIRCALEASKKRENHNLEDFFKNWASVWRQKSSLEYSQLLLRVDVHGPSNLRGNMQLSNLPEFQEFYQIKYADKMYLAKDKMVSIW